MRSREEISHGLFGGADIFVEKLRSLDAQKIETAFLCYSTCKQSLPTSRRSKQQQPLLECLEIKHGGTEKKTRTLSVIAVARYQTNQNAWLATQESPSASVAPIPNLFFCVRVLLSG